MKKLFIYKKLGLKNNDEVFSYFIDTLRKSIFTWDYFVDWDKIVSKVSKFETELNILNTLIGKSNSEEIFVKFMRRYPRVKAVLPLLIAVRINKLRSFFVADDKNVHNLRAELKRDYFRINRTVNQKTEIELKRFYVESGLKAFLENKSIKNLVDYYTGIEVGMDTNARKNRSGVLMEDIVENYLSANFSNTEEIEFISQANGEKIEKKWGVKIKMDKTNRRFDFAVLNKKRNRLILLETNYYGGGGTKLKATAGEYRHLNDYLKKQGLSLVWITDGKGWNTAVNPLRETFDNNDYVFNLKFLKEGALEEILR